MSSTYRLPVYIINGPNLNLVGTREPSIYGNQSFEEFIPKLKQTFQAFDLQYFQSNHEGVLLDFLQSIPPNVAGLVINAGALAHYSYALYDGLRAVHCLKVEVHISNVFQRENFRQVSVLTPACEGMICGLGMEGYYLALQWLQLKLQTPMSQK